MVFKDTNKLDDRVNGLVAMPSLSPREQGVVGPTQQFHQAQGYRCSCRHAKELAHVNFLKFKIIHFTTRVKNIRCHMDRDYNEIPLMIHISKIREVNSVVALTQEPISQPVLTLSNLKKDIDAVG